MNNPTSEREIATLEPPAEVKRYLDLFVNEEARTTFQKRSRIVRHIRNFLEVRGYLEVETPMMHAIPGGATARPFQTHHNALDMELYLRVAPELYLKRLIVGGMDRVFEINRNFRNEGIDATHNPEFTMLEFYQAYATWQELADLTEELIHELVVEVSGGSQLTYQGTEISFARPFRRAGYDELVAEALGVPVAVVHDLAALRAAIGEGAPATLGACWERVFDEKVESTLVHPTFVTRFPIEISPLARATTPSPTSPTASSCSSRAARSRTPSTSWPTRSTSPSASSRRSRPRMRATTRPCTLTPTTSMRSPTACRPPRARASASIAW